MKIAVTGANGYIGRALLKAIKNRGFGSLALSRVRPISQNEWQFYDLGDLILSIPHDVDCVVHLAMNFEIKAESDKQKEIGAAAVLFESAQKIGAKIIYVSSQTASSSAPTMYGQTKWEIEKIVNQFGGVSIRPGLVYGGATAGLFARLADLVEKSLFVPRFIPAPKVQPVHVDDLCESILRICCSDNRQNSFCIASPLTVQFDEFLQLLSVCRFYKHRINVYIPRFIVDVLHFVFPKSSVFTRLHSLFNLPYMKSQNDLSVLALELRDLRSGLHKSGECNRRLLLLEGYVLFSYLYRERSKLFRLRRYVKFLELNGTSEPLFFRYILCVFPSWIGLIERSSFLKRTEWYQKFIQRLDVATVLAEASSEGAVTYLRLSKNNTFIGACIALSTVVFIEVIYRLVSFCIGPLSKTLISKKVK